MGSSPTTDNMAETSHLVAAIDIGANLIRMAVANVLPDGSVEPLEQLKRGVRLGQDVFRRGRISSPTLRTAVAILRDYRKLLDSYQVTHIRAVATSAVREARNRDMFLDRIVIATGLDVEVIDTAEESRLAAAPLPQSLSAILPNPQAKILLADVGGGSTLLTVLHGSEIVASQGLPLGSIRLPELLGATEENPAQAARMLGVRIADVIHNLDKTFPMKDADVLILAGGDARFAAQQAGAEMVSPNLFSVKKSAFTKFTQQCLPLSSKELSRELQLPFADAETLNPALLVYRALIDLTRFKTLFVSGFSMRDGLLQDMARQVTGRDDPSLAEGVIHAATSLAEKYSVDLNSARNVATLARRLFDELQNDHRLGGRYRLLLEVAALLHGVGHFVGARSHHKHSYYIISNSEIFGLNRDELTIVAHVARYHRRSAPKASHTDYMILARQRRMIISKLAAILRVADALNKSHGLRSDNIRFTRNDEELIVTVSGVGDLTLERRSISLKADLFEDIYGLRLRLEEEQPAPVREQPSESLSG